MKYPPLPKGKAYSLNKDEGKWSLSSLTSIASRIALTLRNQPPYGKAFFLLYKLSLFFLCHIKVAQLYLVIV